MGFYFFSEFRDNIEDFEFLCIDALLINNRLFFLDIMNRFPSHPYSIFN